jgi:WD40 repeat protein
MSDKFTVRRVQLDVETEELCAAFSPDRTRVLTAVDRTVLLWDVETGNSLRTFEGHTGPVVALAWSADQQQFLSGAHNNVNVIRLRDVLTAPGSSFRPRYCSRWSCGR